ncbi:MAG TPA: hypothetical protein VIK31_01460 [Propionibacteriaceae bacterium]
MTSAFGTAGLEVHYTRRFLDDARQLPEVLVRKVDEAVIKIRSQGIYQSGLLAEKVHGNPDGRFRFLRVDLQYRMVAAAEGRDILLMKVGNHVADFRKSPDSISETPQADEPRKGRTSLAA